MYGGGSKWEQSNAVKEGCEILVATPVRTEGGGREGMVGGREGWWEGGDGGREGMVGGKGWWEGGDGGREGMVGGTGWWEGGDGGREGMVGGRGWWEGGGKEGRRVRAREEQVTGGGDMFSVSDCTGT